MHDARGLARHGEVTDNGGDNERWHADAHSATAISARHLDNPLTS